MGKNRYLGSNYSQLGRDNYNNVGLQEKNTG
jgi:hypothetical protein